jgi:hypothetical protein
VSGGGFRTVPIKTANVVRNYYVLPCCLLLLNLCVELVSYKAKMIDDVLVRTGVIIAMVLFGGSLVSFVVAPAISALIGALHRSSRERWGGLGEAVFLGVLGVAVFWLYYRIYILGPESILPAAWHNPRHR